MTGDEREEAGVWLVPLFGPALPPVRLAPREGGLLIGRQEQCDVRLRSEQVSRQHARLRFESGQWRLQDLNSRWGTFLNGVRLSGTDEVPLREGDLIRISPWTLNVSRSAGARGGVESLNDGEHTRTVVKPVETQQAAIASDLLGLLLESAAGMHAAENEKAMAEVLMDAAVRGSGLPNAAVLRPLDGVGRVEVVASRRARANGPAGDAALDASAPVAGVAGHDHAGRHDAARPGGGGGALFSRSLLSLASTGVVAQLSSAAPMNTSESIVQMNIDAALCVPLMLGTAPAAYLYLDSRGTRGVTPRTLSPSAGAFCLALGRMAALALANLKRIDIERRQAQIMADILAGAEAQRWILPERRQRVGPLEYVGESRPGRHVAGDFFDVIPLSGTCVAVTLGDVSGKGVAASVLMSAAQGYLQAALRAHGDVERAVTELNRYVNPRTPSGKFITMWVGIFDGVDQTLRYVDAGHGYALLVGADGACRTLGEGDGLPVGVHEEAKYTSTLLTLSKGDRVVLVSDGIVEQTDGGAGGRRESEQFRLEGVQACVAALGPGADEVAGLFEAVVKHAGTKELTDDATAVVLRW